VVYAQYPKNLNRVYAQSIDTNKVQQPDFPVDSFHWHWEARTSDLLTTCKQRKNEIESADVIAVYTGAEDARQ
jgi:hypothetical protein